MEYLWHVEEISMESDSNLYGIAANLDRISFESLWNPLCDVYANIVESLIIESLSNLDGINCLFSCLSRFFPPSSAAS